MTELGYVQCFLTDELLSTITTNTNLYAASKGAPADFKDGMKTLTEGQTKAWQQQQLGCLLWFDKQPVRLLSTHCRVDFMVTITQDRGPHRPSTVTKPTAVLDYNVHKCHVDTVDQLRQYYAMQRKSKKDWPSLAWWLIDVCIINSYTLWCLDTETKIDQLGFRVALMQQLWAA
jgi:hypothetical protein